MISMAMQQQMRAQQIMAQMNALRQQEAVLAATLQQVNARLAAVMQMRPSGSRNVQILVLQQQRAALVAAIQQLQARIVMLSRML
jgi:hypothetical protein